MPEAGVNVNKQGQAVILRRTKFLGLLFAIVQVFAPDTCSTCASHTKQAFLP